MTELKPCPFCGGRAIIEKYETHIFDGEDVVQFLAECPSCQIATNSFATPDGAAAICNRRASPWPEAKKLWEGEEARLGKPVLTIDEWGRWGIHKWTESEHWRDQNDQEPDSWLIWYWPLPEPPKEKSE